MKTHIFSFFTTILVVVGCQNNVGKEAVSTEDTSSEPNYLAVPEGARVFFVNLQDGDEVRNPFVVEMGVEGMEVMPAGDLVEMTGHHHILINGAPMKVGEVIPMDSTNLHYGQGQTEAELTLAPGDYTLVMQFGNGHHESYGPSMSAEVQIRVVE